MRQPLVRLIGMLAATLTMVLICGPPPALAAPPPPVELEAEDGSDWRPERGFALRWRNPPPGGPALAAVRYLVRNPLGAVTIGPARINGPVTRIGGLHLSGGPGAYTAEVWLEDEGGLQGPASTTKVRFDDSRPSGVEPLGEPGWIGRAELPHAIRVTHPTGPAPASGIRGYAISIDRLSDGEPCAAPDRCSDAETDLRGGIADDTLLVPELPEGISFAHAVAVSGSGMRSTLSGHSPLRVDRTDPVTRLAGAPEGWTNHTVLLRATATDSGSGMGPGGEGAPFTAIALDGRPPAVVSGASVGAVLVDEGIHTVAYYARDAAGNVDDGRTTNGRPNPAPRSATVRIDRVAPSVTLVGSAGARDPELIEARVADALAGPGPRGSIEVREVGSGQGFAPLPTSVSGAALRARWPSDDYPPGSYEFRAIGHDAAGNTASGRQRANGTPLTLPSPLKVPARLWASLSGRRNLVAAIGSRPRLSGRLSLTSGDLASDAEIIVIERFDPGARRRERATRIRTDGVGRFAVRLEPGPSRTAFVRFSGDARSSRALSAPLRLGVRPEVRLRSSARVAEVGGAPVVFRGELRGGPGEAAGAGLAVELQFRVGGAPWSEFRSVTTDRRGRFHYRYAFSDDDSRGVGFQFRAFAPTQSDWPYEPGGSRPVAVRGA